MSGAGEGSSPQLRRTRSLSEERAEADIASLEAQLEARMVANKFGECAVLKERIDQMKKAQTDLSGLKVQLEKARATRDFKACAEIQRTIDELKVCSCFHQFPSTPFFSNMLPSVPQDSKEKLAPLGEGSAGRFALQSASPLQSVRFTFLSPCNNDSVLHS